MSGSAVPATGEQVSLYAACSASLSRKRLSAIALVPLLAFVLISCCGPAQRGVTACAECTDGDVDPSVLARRFAPVLSLHPGEPFHVIAVIPVLHPSRPLIAYHIFFDDDMFFAGRGKSADHEIAWVEYDPVTLKVADVFTLWHRTVLRTDSCVIDARLSGQRPKIDVQWGQHGLLPSGWHVLATARPRLELAMHYRVAKIINRLPRVSTRKPAVSFRGSYADYLTFTKEVRTADYIIEQDMVKAEHSLDFLRSRLGMTFLPKKEWPDW